MVTELTRGDGFYLNCILVVGSSGDNLCCQQKYAVPKCTFLSSMTCYMKRVTKWFEPELKSSSEVKLILVVV